MQLVVVEQAISRGQKQRLHFSDIMSFNTEIFVVFYSQMVTFGL